MAKTWQVQEAKNKLSEVIDGALDSGPQILTRRGEKVAVVISYETFLELRQKQTKLSALFRPLEGLDLERDKSPVRPGPKF